MLQKLKASSKSSNFWNNLATVGSLLLIAFLTSLQNPETIKDINLSQFATIILFNAANILYHSNKEQ